MELKENELKEKIVALTKERDDIMAGANQRISYLGGQIDSLEWLLAGCPNGELTPPQSEQPDPPQG